MKYKIIAWLGLFVFAGLIAAYVAEFQWLSLTFGAGELMLKSAIAGLVAGILAGWFFSKKTKDAVTQLQIWSACIIACILFSPLAGSFTNRMFSPSEEVTRVEFFEEKPFFASLGLPQGEMPRPTGWFVFVNYDGKLRRLKSKVQAFPEAKRGDSVEILLKKGGWNFEIARLKEKED